MVFIKRLQTKTAINASHAMRNDLISFQIKYNAAMSFQFYNSQSRPTSNNRTLLQTKREISRAYQSSQKIFRVRRPFFNPPWPNKLNNTPYIPYYQCEVNTGKLLNCLSSGAYNLKAIKSSCNLKIDLNRAKVGHFSDVIFASLEKLFNKNSKL